jgi:RNA polymerase sigma-70 factor (ECF subfamily)
MGVQARADGDSELLGGGDGPTAVDFDPIEAEIKRAIASGDMRAAMAICARAHALALGRFCMALMGSQAEAQDLLQETLLAAHGSFASWRGEGSLRAWLFGIARRTCARHLERRLRQEHRLRLVQSSPDTERDDERLLNKERAERARSALERIRPSEREALILRYASELSFKEVGIACGIDEAAARKRVSRALIKLRAVLKEKEVK